MLDALTTYKSFLNNITVDTMMDIVYEDSLDEDWLLTFIKLSNLNVKLLFSTCVSKHFSIIHIRKYRKTRNIFKEDIQQL